MSENVMKQTGIILPVNNQIILPHTTVWLDVPELSETMKNSLHNGHSIFVALPLRGEAAGTDGEEDYHHFGVVFDLRNLRKTTNGWQIVAEARQRVRVSGMFRAGSMMYAQFDDAPDSIDLDSVMQEKMLDYLKQIVREASKGFQGASQYLQALDGIRDVNSMIVWMGRYLPSSPDEKYDYLKMDSLKERSLAFMDALNKQKEAVKWNIQVGERMSQQTSKYYREQMLREQMKAIRKELNGGKESGKKDYRTRIEEAGMPEEIRQSALEEVEKLEAQPQGSAETSVLQNHLDFILSLPWRHDHREDPDLTKAKEILDEDHYGLEQVKKRIIEHLAVMKLKKDNKGSILLFAGPPGTGKTSLGKSIARALDRRYVRLSLGGIRDESEIRGHRRTYVGAMPGRILTGIRQAGTTNPVMVLDEVDKLNPGGFSGDPSSALLEVLDPEQNSTFTDHYLDLPYDLSDVFFIATANSLDTIPGPLLDRMEVIQISSYTEEEKFHIAREHLIPQVLNDTGIQPSQLDIPDDTLKAVISDYTMEGGVRGLKKQLETIARSVSTQIVEGSAKLPRTVERSELEDLLGRKVSFHERALSTNAPGVVTGLAWTQVGGEILFIEAAGMPGSGGVILTGQLGDVMKESARISLSLLKSRMPMSAFNFQEHDIHIHVPSGSVKKDGPSAGITMFTALASLVTGKAVDPHLAMTGEITLRGAVMPIGGLKEKLLAAKRAGITKALIPSENVADLKDLPESIRSSLTIIPVNTVEDVLREALGITLPPQAPASFSGFNIGSMQ